MERRDSTYLFVVEIVLEPVPHLCRGQAVADVHEPEAADVGAVAVVEQTHQLLPGQLQGEQFEEEAKG